MVTVYRAFGFRFVIFTNDHSPPHVHVFGNGAEALLRLDPLTLVWSNGFKAPELKRIMAEAGAEHGRLIEEWNRIHG